MSTDRQAEEGLGLAVQRESIEAWADEAGCDVVGWRQDSGRSGSNGLEGRVGLAMALEDLRAGDADTLVVARLDRLARDLVVQEQLLRDLWAMDAEVYSCVAAEAEYLVRDDEAGDPSRRLIRQMLGAVAEYERALIVLRLAAGRRRKAQEGGYAYGAPPYGWRASGGKLVEVPDEQAVIERIRRWRYVEDLTYADIAERLHVSGVPGPRGPRWHMEAVRRVVRRMDA